VILTIWDAGGSDLIDASDLSTDNRIDLRPGQYSAIGSIDDNIAVAAAVQDGGTVINYIENAWGGSGNDRLTGNDTHNQLLGNGGKDRLMGGLGDDTLEGGSGRDRLFGNHGRDELNGGSHRDRLLGNRGNDELNGGGGNDRLLGGGGRDVLDGGGGNDRMTGSGGADTFVFGRGRDTVTDFNASNSAEDIDLRNSAEITDYNDLMANHASSVSGGVLIDDLNGNTMLLEGVSLGNLGADDFLF